MNEPILNQLLELPLPGGAQSVLHPRSVPDPSDRRKTVLTGSLLHFVYSYLLRECFKLSDKDSRELAALGFDEQALDRACYRSTPEPLYLKQSGGSGGGTAHVEVKRLVIESEMNQPHALGDIFNMSGGVRVPGLFFDGERMRLNLRAGRTIAPVRAVDTQIVSLQIYRQPLTATRPLWFDSQDLPRGARAKRWPHFARPEIARVSGGVVIAENTLLADLHAWREGEAAVGINGLLPEVFARTLRTSLPEVSLVAFACSYPEAELLHALTAEGFEIYEQGAQEVM